MKLLTHQLPLGALLSSDFWLSLVVWSIDTFHALKSVPCSFRQFCPSLLCTFSSEGQCPFINEGYCYLAGRDAGHGVLVPRAGQHLATGEAITGFTGNLVDDPPVPLQRNIEAVFALVKLFHRGNELLTIDSP